VPGTGTGHGLLHVQLVKRPDGVRAFPVTVDSVASFGETDFFDQSGKQTKALIHVVEQDVFSANGKKLTGLPFTFEQGNIAGFCAALAP
jgi:hypothetical protein